MADRQYELVYILPPDTTEQQVTELHSQVEAVVSKMHGQIEKTENWGRRRLAYEISHHKEGVYGLEVINGSGELMKELDRRLKVMDMVIRHMVVRVRSTTFFSSSTRTTMCRITRSITLRRRSSSFISSPVPLITSRT